jgi:hypothetical protein
LIDEIAVDCDEDIDAASCKMEKFAVPLSRPSCLGYGLHLVIAEVFFQSARKTLVK